MGDHRIYPLGPDPAGTPTISGTSTNFGVMTANGTIGAWNAAAALAAIDDIPPTLGASADGIVAVAAHATDYVEVPMATLNVSGLGSIRAVRPLIPLWAASATAATCRVNGWDGSVSTVLLPEIDPNADTSSTPPWLAQMWNPVGGWTQAKLNAAAIRFGSNDATPKIGFHAILLEVAVQTGDSLRVAEVTGLEGVTAAAAVDVVVDSVTGGPLAYTASAPPEFDAVVDYMIRGSPVTTTVPAGTTDLEIVDAADATEVTSVSIGAA
jgi:hypothetical protein